MTRDEWVELTLDAAEEQGHSRYLDDPDAAAFVASILLSVRRPEPPA